MGYQTEPSFVVQSTSAVLVNAAKLKILMLRNVRAGSKPAQQRAYFHIGTLRELEGGFRTRPYKIIFVHNINK
jgi:hypothetical protein